jgi:hypothetical protein
MSNYTRLRAVSNIGDSLLLDQVTTNLMSFLDWGFLGIGAFVNISRPTSGVYGGNEHRLRLSEDRNYRKGQVWEGFRSNWVWESGIEYPVQPIQISGVYLNNTFLPTATTGTFSYSINYPLGRVVFNNPISPTSQVELNYSFKQISVQSADSPWFKELQFNSYRVDDSHFNLYGSGIWSTAAQNRIQLPAVVVEFSPRRTLTGKELGGGSFIYQDYNFHIFAETSFERGNLLDILTFQKQQKLFLYDKNLIQNANAWPLDYFGSIAPSALCYPDLVNNYFNHKAIYFYDTSGQEAMNYIPGLFCAMVRATFEIDSPEV